MPKGQREENWDRKMFQLLGDPEVSAEREKPPDSTDDGETDYISQRSLGESNVVLRTKGKFGIFIQQEGVDHTIFRYNKLDYLILLKKHMAVFFHLL